MFLVIKFPSETSFIWYRALAVASARESGYSMFSGRCVSIEQSSGRSVRASDRVGLRNAATVLHSSMFLEFTRQETAISISKVIGFVLLDVEHRL